MFSMAATYRLNDLRQPWSRRRSVSCDLSSRKQTNCRISIDHLGCLVIVDDMFDVGDMLFERSPEAAISHGAAAVSRGAATVSSGATAVSHGANGGALVAISLT